MIQEGSDSCPDPMPPEIAALRGGPEPVWIFAYGSLMWDREFPRIAAERALLYGYHRRFCLYSYDYRGTRTRPGLTLGLDRGGACRGYSGLFRQPPAGDELVTVSCEVDCVGNQLLCGLSGVDRNDAR